MIVRLLLVALVVAPASALMPSGARRLGAVRCGAHLQRRQQRQRRHSMTMLFLDEVPLKEDALQWAKETSRTKFDMNAVVAIYDDADTPIYVGYFRQAPQAIAHLAKKHGVTTVSKVRYEEFPPEVFDDPMGRQMMASLSKGWLQQVAEALGKTPVGNAEGGWDEFDATKNPFVAGYLGDLGEAEAAAKRTPEEEAEFKLQDRRENMKRKLDEAILAGDEDLAIKLLRRLNNVNEGSDDSADLA